MATAQCQATATNGIITCHGGTAITLHVAVVGDVPIPRRATCGIDGCCRSIGQDGFEVMGLGVVADVCVVGKLANLEIRVVAWGWMCSAIHAKQHNAVAEFTAWGQHEDLLAIAW